MVATRYQTDDALALIPWQRPGVKSGSKDGRKRRQVKFWLNWNDPGDQAVGEWLNWFKERRQMTGMMRDAVRLYVDLMNGCTEVLDELFPSIRVRYEARIEREVERQVALRVAELTPKPDSALEARLAKLEALLAGQGAPTPTPPQPTGPQPLRPLTPAPADDADAGLLLVRKAESDGKQSAMAFLDSAFSLANK